ncbi:MAG: hypothetical protein O3B13_07960 [Planctomycetota bacterium]|nr:hypothetical protein [Planctomycetota bacterium]
MRVVAVRKSAAVRYHADRVLDVASSSKYGALLTNVAKRVSELTVGHANPAIFATAGMIQTRRNNSSPFDYYNRYHCGT